MKAKYFFRYDQILKPSEIFKGLGRIFITSVIHYNPAYLNLLRKKIQLSRYDFTISRHKWLYGIEIYVYTGSVFDEVGIHKNYEVTEFGYLKRFLRKGDVFLDVGANIGLYTLMASNLVGQSGKVLSFEPSKREYNLLIKNLKHNKCSNVDAFMVALSDYTGEGELFVSGQSNTGINTLMTDFTRKISLENVDKVPVYKLDDFLQSINLPKITVMKIDIEGGEQLLLYGAKHTLEKFKPILMIEINRLNLKNDDSSNILKLLDAYNYKPFFYTMDGGLTSDPPSYVYDEKHLCFDAICIHKSKCN